MIQTLINMALCFKSRPSQNELGEWFSVNRRKQSNLKSNYYIENINITMFNLMFIVSLQM